MSRELALTLAILIIAILFAVFVISFVLYKKTPVPKGCEHLKISEENCANCSNKDCYMFNKKEGE